MLVWRCTGSQGPVWTAGGLLPCSRASWILACYQNTGASRPSPQQTDLPRKALILCKSRTFEQWILAYTGVEFKGVSSITSSISVVWECVCTSGVHWFYWPPENMTLFALQAVKGGGRKEGGCFNPDSCSPELTLDPVAYSGGPSASAQRHRLFPCSNRILTFVILSGVFTPISPKPIEERENSAATALK